MQFDGIKITRIGNKIPKGHDMRHIFHFNEPCAGMVNFSFYAIGSVVPTSS